MSYTNKDSVSALPTTLFSNRLFLIIIFIVLEIFIALFFFSDYKRHDVLYRTQMMQTLDAGYRGATASYDYTTHMIFNDVINKPEVLKLIALALDDKNKRDDYRNELYRLMLPSYEKQKAIGILQFHFHLKDGTGFLRMHAPEKYGDNLFRRTAVYQINKKQTPVKGYEVGYFADGYRFMYPLFYNGRHVGSVEFGITAEGIVNRLNQIYPAHYTFMINRTIVDNMTYADWKKRNFRESGLSDRFVIGQKEIEDAIITDINQKLKNRMSDRLTGMERFVEKETTNGKDYLIVFLPIKDVTGRPAAYFVQYLSDEYSGHHFGLAIFDIALFTVLLAGIFYSIDNIQSRRRSLEEKNIELEQMTESLNKSEKKYRDMFESATDAIFILDLEGNFIDVNSTAYSRLGYSKKEMLSMHISQLDPPEFGAKVPERLKQLRDHGFAIFETAHIRKDGTVMPVEVNARLYDYDGKKVYFSFIRDITERKMMENNLKESEGKFRDLVESSSDWVWEINENGLYVYSSPKVKDILGYDVNDVLGKSPFYFMPEDEAEKVRTLFRQIQSQQKPFYGLENINRHKDGDIVVLETSGVPVFDKNGQFKGFRGIDRDITRRKKIESELRERMQLAELGADIGIALTTGTTIRESLQLCSEALVKHLDVLFARIWTFDEHDNILQLQASSGLYTHIDGGHSRIQMGKYKIGIIAQNRKPHHTNNVLGDPLVHDQEWVKREGIVSFAGHPLIVERNLVGAMAMFSRRPLTDVTLNALSYVADEIGIGIKQKLSGEKIIRAKEEWEKTFDTIPDIVTVTDNHYKIVRANKALADRLNVKREDLIGKFCYNIIHGTEEPPSNCPHSKTPYDNKEYMDELHEKTLNGYFLLSCTPIFDSQCNLITTVQVLRDISERKKMEEHLKTVSITDELTGLFNRRGFFTLAEKEFKLANRHKRRMSLIYLDLDSLKIINDELGHQAGDLALVDAANILRKSFRESDIIGRIGGDEFAVLITDDSEADIEKIAIDHIQQNLKIHNEQAGRNYALLLSMGFAHYNPDSPYSISVLITQADSSMYEDKKKRKFKKNM